MLITRLHLKNWRNFKTIDVALRERVYVVGPNASGKSNLFDVLRFLRDIAKPEGGGFQKAVKDRGGIPKIRCLAARRDPEIQVEIEVAESADSPSVWRYLLAFRSEGKGQQRALVSREQVQDLRSKKMLLDRPTKEDRQDLQRMTQTALEQISANREFREVADFLATVTYLHLVPQLLKHAEDMGGYRLESDPFGQGFLERVADVQARTRDARLRKIETALQACVPNMRELRFNADEKGKPHLEALYQHWRPDAGWQREDQFSDGTLRLLGIMWSLLDGDSLLLLEEPELSLNEAIVERIHGLIWKMQRSAKHRRQVFISTHSEALLKDHSIDPREVLRLEPTDNGTLVHQMTPDEESLVAAGYTIAEVVLPKTRPRSIEQLAQFSP
ncbi:AAA family ATPase [Roseateles sp.]|uniref:AAA family ATPase n=1 Tax=Roseateles sp. TaxID=1971397 RepID=UPI0031D48CE8